MTTQTEAQFIAALNNAVVNKAVQDPAFRASLLKNPKAAVEQAVGKPLPAGIELEVLEATASKHTIVLPFDGKAKAGGELSDADLESVSGGSKSGFNSFMAGLGGQNDHSDAGSFGAGLSSGALHGLNSTNDGTQMGALGQGAGIAINQGYNKTL